MPGGWPIRSMYTSNAAVTHARTAEASPVVARRTTGIQGGSQLGIEPILRLAGVSHLPTMPCHVERAGTGGRLHPRAVARSCALMPSRPGAVESTSWPPTGLSSAST
jgi:hypothetical protein